MVKYQAVIREIDVTISARGGDTGTKGNKEQKASQCSVTLDMNESCRCLLPVLACLLPVLVCCCCLSGAANPSHPTPSHTTSKYSAAPRGHGADKQTSHALH